MKIDLARLLGILTVLMWMPFTASAGFSIENGQLIDNNGNAFVMRGINYPYAWFTSRYPTTTQQDFANMAATKANTIRIVLGSGAQFLRTSGPEITNLIQFCKANKLIAVLEVHDSTGFGDSSAAVPISNSALYWQSADVVSALQGQEDFAIIDIANEPFGNNSSATAVSDTVNAIKTVRAAGLKHTIMVDAANWGQDSTLTTQKGATTILAADTLKNTIISVHMYEVYTSLSTISNYMAAYQSVGLPLVVGEFGIQNNGIAVDAPDIMAQAQARGIGYIGWSWSGNGSCCTALDIVSSFSTTLSSWGNLLINGANGIAATAQPASVFTGSASLSVSSTSMSFPATAASSPVSITSNSNWSVSPSASWLTVAPASGSNNGTVAVSAAANTGTSNRTGTITVTGGGLTQTIAVTQSGASGGGGGSGAACHIGYTVGSQWSGGFGAAITINNTGTTAISNWTLTWSFANGQTITQLWNGTATQSGANVVVTNLSYNGSIPAGGSYSSMGFNGSLISSSNAVPTSFALNGTACK
jgi:mannan endo-1,4-beta-mannosidase